MTVIAPCTHGMPTPAACVDCMADGPVASPTVVEPERMDGAPIVSRYSGHCPGCNLPITAGQMIDRTNRGSWRHAEERCAP